MRRRRAGKLQRRYGRAFVDRHGLLHHGHPLDVVIEHLGRGFMVRRRDPSHAGMAFDSHERAVLWANSVAMGRPVTDESGGAR